MLWAGILAGAEPYRGHEGDIETRGGEWDGHIFRELRVATQSPELKKAKTATTEISPLHVRWKSPKNASLSSVLCPLTLSLAIILQYNLTAFPIFNSYKCH